MVLSYDKIFGKKKEGEGTADKAVLSLNEEDAADARKEAAAEAKGETMSDKKYKAAIDNFVEGNARHVKGELLKVKIDEARATALINAGYIEEVIEGEAKAEEKAIEAPIKKVITGEDVEDKGATGKGAGLLKKKKK